MGLNARSKWSGELSVPSKGYTYFSLVKRSVLRLSYEAQLPPGAHISLGKSNSFEKTVSKDSEDESSCSLLLSCVVNAVRCRHYRSPHV
jgi:hypothetical protein